MLRLAVKNSVLDALVELPAREAEQATAALESIPAGFGRPHLHSGLGIRQLRSGVYEARIGLGLRAIFTREGEWLRAQFVGHHDEVKKWLKK